MKLTNRKRKKYYVPHKTFLEEESIEKVNEDSKTNKRRRKLEKEILKKKSKN